MEKRLLEIFKRLKGWAIAVYQNKILFGCVVGFAVLFLIALSFKSFLGAASLFGSLLGVSIVEGDRQRRVKESNEALQKQIKIIDKKESKVLQSEQKKTMDLPNSELENALDKELEQP